MKTFTLEMIAFLLVVAVLDMTEGKLAHAKHAHAKLDHAKLAHSQLAQEKVGHDRDDDDDGDYDGFVECVENNDGSLDDVRDYFAMAGLPDSQILKCAAGCFHESINLTINGELNKIKLTKFLVQWGIEEAEATKDAEDCATSLVDIPESDICKLGEAVSICMIPREAE